MPHGDLADCAPLRHCRSLELPSLGIGPAGARALGSTLATALGAALAVAGRVEGAGLGAVRSSSFLHARSASTTTRPTPTFDLVTVTDQCPSPARMATHLSHGTNGRRPRGAVSAEHRARLDPRPAGRDEKEVKSGESKPPESRGPDRERLRRELGAFMAQRGLRSTEQRRLIIDKLFEAKEHVTIDQLLATVRHEDPRVGYATVYRTMKLLAEGGLVEERKFGDGFTRYELADEETHHDHLICVSCGKITEFEEPAIEELQERVAARYDFTVQHHKHELYGICADCAEKRGGGVTRRSSPAR
jgi:Fur family transcriptional regulator, ferric uptake regulator